MKCLALGSGLLLAACSYDFSLPANADGQSCSTPDLTTLLCDDFERPGRAFDPALYEDFTSTPQLIDEESRMLELSPPDQRSEWLKTRRGTAVTRVHFAFSLRVTKLPATGPRQVAPLRLGEGGTEARLYLHLSPDGRQQLVEEFATPDGNENTEFELARIDGALHVYELDVDLARSTATLRVDGASLLRPDSTFPNLAKIGGSAPVSVLLGANYAPPPESGREAEAAVTLHIDDVLLAAR